MTFIIFLIVIAIAIFIVVYRSNEKTNVYKFVNKQIGSLYNKYTPYSFRVIREKVKELGQEYTTRQYIIQAIVFAAGAAVITYLYFYNIGVSLIYAAVSIAVIPFLTYLRCKRVYSEFIFEQIQVYTTNTIMEFGTTQSFVKALEGVYESGVLEDPVKSDVKTMIDMAYENGTIEESIEFFNAKYDFYIVKNMHQLFLQVTKEGAKDSGESFENMMLDIDLLVEGVYRDKMDREASHKKFVMFGIALYFLVMLIQTLLDKNNYKAMLSLWYVQALLHIVIIINSYFIISGEKFYNEDTGVE